MSASCSAQAVVKHGGTWSRPTAASTRSNCARRCSQPVYRFSARPTAVEMERYFAEAEEMASATPRRVPRGAPWPLPWRPRSRQWCDPMRSGSTCRRRIWASASRPSRSSHPQSRCRWGWRPSRRASSSRPGGAHRPGRRVHGVLPARRRVRDASGASRGPRGGADGSDAHTLRILRNSAGERFRSLVSAAEDMNQEDLAD